MKNIYILILLLCLIQCKAQKMNTIILDPGGELKQLQENSKFKDFFSFSDTNIVIEKKNENPFTGILTVLFNTENVFAIYSFKNGKQEGKQETYYKNGEKNTVLSLQQGKYQGEFKQYYENGNPKSLSQFDKGKQVSLISYFEEGGKNSEFSLNQNGAKEEEKIYNASGNIYSHKLYSKTDVKAIYYYENGEIESKGEELKKGGLSTLFFKKGLWKYYYENGNKKEEGIWGVGGRHGKNIVKKGTWKYYNEEGKLISEKEYNNMGMSIEK